MERTAGPPAFAPVDTCGSILRSPRRPSEATSGSQCESGSSSRPEAKVPAHRSGSRYRRLQQRIRERAAAGEACCLCRKPIDPSLRYPHPLSCTVQHLRLVSEGGDILDEANAAPAHLSCNVADGNRRRAVSPRQKAARRAWARRQGWNR